MTEKRREYLKNYRAKNKEKISAYNKAYLKEYYQANKDKASDYNKEWRNNKKSDKYTLYLLPNENYVGVTNQLELRIRNHKKDYNRNTDGYQVINTFNTKREALFAERLLHADGYSGRNSTYKKETIEQILNCKIKK